MGKHYIGNGITLPSISYKRFQKLQQRKDIVDGHIVNVYDANQENDGIYIYKNGSFHKVILAVVDDKETQSTQETHETQHKQGVQGIQDIQGEQGVQGIQGIQGVQGTQGVQGIQDDTVQDVFDDDYILITKENMEHYASSNSCVNVSAVIEDIDVLNYFGSLHLFKDLVIRNCNGKLEHQHTFYASDSVRIINSIFEYENSAKPYISSPNIYIDNSYSLWRTNGKRVIHNINIGSPYSTGFFPLNKLTLKNINFDKISDIDSVMSDISFNVNFRWNTESVLNIEKCVFNKENVFYLPLINCEDADKITINVVDTILSDTTVLLHFYMDRKKYNVDVSVKNCYINDEQIVSASQFKSSAHDRVSYDDYFDPFLYLNNPIFE